MTNHDGRARRRTPRATRAVAAAGTAAGLAIGGLGLATASAAPVAAAPAAGVPGPRAAAGCFWCSPAPIPPPRCRPVSQGDGTYEWYHVGTRTLGRRGHGVRTHDFWISYVNPLNGMMARKVSCRARF